MSSKAVKSSLKSAKQAIHNKDFEAALKFCKEILSKDEENYNGLVFCGLCHAELQHFADAKMCYMKAMHSTPDQPLAYQGLVNLFTKHHSVGLSMEDNAVLISAYQKLIDLSNREDAKKLMELVTGLATAFCTNHDFKQAFGTLSQQLNHLSKALHNNDELQQAVVGCLRKMRLSAVTQNLIEYSELVFDCATWYSSQPTITNSEKEEVLRDLLHYAHADAALVKSCMDSLRSFCMECFSPGSSALAAELFIQMMLQENYFVKDGCEEVVTSYSGPYKDILTGFQFFSSGNYKESAEFIERGLSVSSGFIPAWLTLCRAQLLMHSYMHAEKTARCALQACKHDLSSWLARLHPLDDLKLDLTVCLAEAMSGNRSQASLNMAKTTFEKLLKLRPVSEDVVLGLAKVEIKVQNWTEANTLLGKAHSMKPDCPRVQSWKAYVKYMVGNREEAISELQSVCGQHPNEFIAVFLLGKLMWSFSEEWRRDKTKCFSCFLKAAKLDVYYGETFRYLGQYYRDIAKDAVRAKKCYQKAYSLDSTDEDAASSLADQLIAEGEFDAAITLFENITEEAGPGTCKWAWLRLGLCRLKTKDCNSAIKCFQAALRADSEDHICWECLGEGYMSRGSYTAAWKAFNKARELYPESVYGMYQMASVKQILGQFAEAVSEYRDLLNIYPDYVPALKGLAEANLSLAKQMLQEGRDQTCLDYVSEATQQLTKALSLSGSLSCLWHLLGEGCTLVHPLDGSKVQVAVPGKLMSTGQCCSENFVVLDKVEMLKLGAKCYSRAISLTNNMSSYWHSLGVNLFYQAREEDDSETASAFASRASAILQKAISLEPNNHLLWNSLGVVSVSEFAENWSLAQHAFIKSIKLEPNNCVAWSNLGAMYLVHSQVELAHKAFKVAQSLEPSYPNSWIGQALVAECIGSEEAMDLFRHASELGLHPEAGIGYASGVCATIMECADRSQRRYREIIHDMNALSASLTQLSKFCSRNPKCSWAFSMLAFILERSGLNRFAADVYKQAMEVMESHAADDGTDTSSALKLLQARINYARSLCLNARYGEAEDTLRKIPTITDTRDLCVLALVLRKAGKAADAMEVYEQCLQRSSGEQRAPLTVAMATLLWQLGDINKCKELLMPLAHTYLPAAQTMVAVDVIQNSFDPVHLQTLTEFASTSSSSDAAFQNCLLSSAAFQISDADAACRHVQKYIRRFPFDWRCRDLLSRIVRSGAVARPLSLACVASVLASRNFGADESFSSVNRDLSDRSSSECSDMSKSVQLSCASALLACGRHSFGASAKSQSALDALKCAQRHVHSYPHSAQSWSVLSAACHAHDIFMSFNGESPNFQAECRKMSAYVEEKSDSPALRDWATQHAALSCSIGSHTDPASDLSKMDKSSEGRSNLALMFRCAEMLQNTGRLDVSLLNQMRDLLNAESSYSRNLMVTAHVCRSAKLYQEADGMLRGVLPRVTKREDKLAILAQLLIVALKAKLVEPKADVGWSSTTSDMLTSVPAGATPCVSQVLEGLCRFAENNLRKCRACLNRALNNDIVRADYCLSKSVAAWYLFRVHHEKDDDQEKEKLVTRFENDRLLLRIRKQLANA